MIIFTFNLKTDGKDRFLTWSQMALTTQSVPAQN
jgi:hypothetical protein